jgi:predicted Rossmann fold nucleotide-binding protein DprA/Smf involved in DNA uptake
MKKLLLVIALCVALFSNHINWLSSYNKALQKANNQNKPLMILLIKNNCKMCKNIVYKAFSNQDYIKDLNKKYISVIVNFDDENYPIELFYTTLFPTLFFVDAKSETFIKEPWYQQSIVNNLKNKLF